MEDVEIRFEREGLEGIVPVGTYLNAAARRFGIKDIPVICPAEIDHEDVVTVTEGASLLSEPTAIEREHFKAAPRKENTRLACQTKIEKPGVVVVMTEEKKTATEENAKVDDKDEQYRKEFVEMPLEKKISNLVQLEAIAFGETIAYVVNSPFKIFEKIGDVMAEFGFKKEEAEKAQATPKEHASNGKSGGAPRKKRPAGPKKKE